MDWINLGQRRDKWQTVGDTVITEFHKVQDISLSVKELAAFKEGFSPMEVTMWVGR
jgi:hypothetical protein